MKKVKLLLVLIISVFTFSCQTEELVISEKTQHLDYLSSLEIVENPIDYPESWKVFCSYDGLNSRGDDVVVFIFFDTETNKYHRGASIQGVRNGEPFIDAIGTNEITSSSANYECNNYQ